MIEIITAMVTATIIIVVCSTLLKYISVKLLAATILCSIAFIYVGFALSDNITQNVIIEVSVALIFYSIAIIGYSKNSYLIAYGIMAHGIWDIFHPHLNSVQTAIPDYWALYCFVTDMILGIYFFLFFKINSKAIKKNTVYPL